MKLGLSMVVKNEERRLEKCLAQIHDLFDDIVVVDTGSTDATVAKLRTDFRARVTALPPPQEDPFIITEARNASLAQNQSDWILVLDADECIDRDDVLRIKDAIADGPDAYFLTWRNRRQASVFDDYKLSLFRNGKGLNFEGLVHSNPQPSARRNAVDAELLEGVTIHHCLNEINAGRSSRKSRLEHYAARFPEWWRYQWFLGYMHYREGDFDSAVPLLRDTCNSLSRQFPVECLNAHLVLTDINARKGNKEKCVRIMRQAEAFYNAVRMDFEVRTNRGMGPWLDRASSYIRNDKLEKVQAYEFAY